MNTQTPPEKMTLEEKQKHLRTLKYVVDICEIVPEARKALTSFLDEVSLDLSHLEGAQADKDRLDWLEDCGDWFVNVTNENEVDEESQWTVLKWESEDVERKGKAKTLRNAIDSAMTAQQKETA